MLPASVNIGLKLGSVKTDHLRVKPTAVCWRVPKLTHALSTVRWIQVTRRFEKENCA